MEKERTKKQTGRLAVMSLAKSRLGPVSDNHFEPLNDQLLTLESVLCVVGTFKSRDNFS